MLLVRAAASLAEHALPLLALVVCVAHDHPMLVMLLLWTVQLALAAQHAESRCVFRTITGRRQCRANAA